MAKCVNNCSPDASLAKLVSATHAVPISLYSARKLRATLHSTKVERNNFVYAEIRWDTGDGRCGRADEAVDGQPTLRPPWQARPPASGHGLAATAQTLHPTWHALEAFQSHLEVSLDCLLHSMRALKPLLARVYGNIGISGGNIVEGAYSGTAKLVYWLPRGIREFSLDCLCIA